MVTSNALKQAKQYIAHWGIYYSEGTEFEPHDLELD